MTNDLVLPFFTSLRVVLLVFIGALAIFHVVLVFMAKLDKNAWKWVDYFWLSFALIGLVGQVAESRRITATGFRSMSEAKLESNFRILRDRIDFYANSEAFCRQPVRTSSSPPEEEFNRIKLEFDRACEWAKKYASTMPKTVQPPFAELLWIEFPYAQNEASSATKDSMDSIRQSVEEYNLLVREHTGLLQSQEKSEFERTLAMLSPLLLAVALALRITKVTGEIRLDR